MTKKFIIKTVFIFFLISNTFANANDVAGMGAISEAAGSSAQAAADQLSADTSQVASNLANATETLGEANSDIGNPDNCRPDTIDEGPGTDVTLMLFAIQYFTKLYPGSEISGDPASEIRTQFLLLNKLLI